MPPFGPLTRRELINVLKQLGFVGPISGKRHQFMQRGTLKVRIPNPHQGDISRDLLRDILRQARISRDEWENV